MFRQRVMSPTFSHVPTFRRSATCSQLVCGGNPWIRSPASPSYGHGLPDHQRTPGLTCGRPYTVALIVLRAAPGPTTSRGVKRELIYSRPNSSISHRYHFTNRRLSKVRGAIGSLSFQESGRSPNLRRRLDHCSLGMVCSSRRSFIHQTEGSEDDYNSF